MKIQHHHTLTLEVSSAVSTHLRKSELVSTIKQLGPWVHQIEIEKGLGTRDISPNGNRKPRNHPAQRWDIISPHLPFSMTGLRVLDVGCAEGFFSIQCAKRGASVVGLEVAKERVVRARWAADQLGFKSIEYCQSTVQELDESYGHFDVTLVLALLYHLRDPLSSLERIASVTTNKIVLETIAVDGEGNSFLKYSPPGECHPTEPKWIPTKACVRDMLEFSGFVQIQEFDSANINRVVFVASKPNI